ncbi:hypothetical protein GCM10010232_31900 [Streptomyces amakusaensis]
MSDVLVSDVHKRIFIASPGDGTVTVTDFSGTVVNTVRGVRDVQDLAISDDSRLVFASAAGENSIVSIEAGTGARKDMHYLYDRTPGSLAYADGKIWFGYKHRHGGGNFGYLKLSGPQAGTAYDLDPRTSYTDPELAASPGTGKLAVAGTSPNSSSGEALKVFDVSDGGVRSVAAQPAPGALTEMAFTPDGSELITAQRTGGHQIRRASDLVRTGAHSTSGPANAVAVRADGIVAAGTESPEGPDIHVFRAGRAEPVRRYDLPGREAGSPPDTLGTGALAWEPGGGRLFAVSRDNSTGQHNLRVLADLALSFPELTVDAPAKASRATELTVTGTLTAGVPLPAGAEVSVTRTDAESPKGVPVGNAKVGANGSFSFRDTPKSGGPVTYRVSYAGGPAHHAASASDTVEVSRWTPGLSVTQSKKVYAYGSTVEFTARLGRTHKNRTLKLYADPAGPDRPRKLLVSGRVNADGELSATTRLTRDTVVTAVYDGDSRSAPRTAGTGVGTQVKVATATSGHDRTGKLDGVTYHYFKRSKDPLFTTAMTAHKDRAQRLSLELNRKGKWLDLSAEDFLLDTAGVSKVTLEGPHKAGDRMRVRSSYLKDESGDSLNTTTHGAWTYFTFTG